MTEPENTTTVHLYRGRITEWQTDLKFTDAIATELSINPEVTKVTSTNINFTTPDHTTLNNLTINNLSISRAFWHVVGWLYRIRSP